MKHSVADELKLESNFCIKRLIRLCKKNCNIEELFTDASSVSYAFNDNSILTITNNIIEIDNTNIINVSTVELTNGADTFNILAKQK